MKIAIIGGGTAGISASIFLAKAGIHATIIERESLLKSNKGLKVGESLPPDAQKLLLELGVWQAFIQQQHRKCLGNQAVWGRAAMEYRDFINHPAGNGWHLDRAAFERLLLKTAQGLGVSLIDNTFISTVAYEEKKWQLQLKGANTILKQTYDFIIDASGRSSWLARRQGVDRLYEDIQFALVAFLQLKDAQETHHATLIETTPKGWWYSAYLPNNLLATNFICQPDKGQRKNWGNTESWHELLQEAHHTHQRISQHDSHFYAPPQFVSADTSILEQTYGVGWIAIGDAAMTYDPVSSHGILMAMTSARDAIKAIVQYHNGRQDAFVAYNALLWASFEQYRIQRKQLYRSEQRFQESSYWLERGS